MEKKIKNKTVVGVDEKVKSLPVLEKIKRFILKGPTKKEREQIIWDSSANRIPTVISAWYRNQKSYYHHWDSVKETYVFFHKVTFRPVFSHKDLYLGKLYLFNRTSEKGGV